MSTSEPRWLSADEQLTWRSFVALRAFFAMVDAELLRDAGMPLAYYEILARLSEAPGRALRMSQLADAAGASKSRVSHAVARLEERGWVRRHDCPTDRRGQVAFLTEEGFGVLRDAAPAHVEHVRRALFDVLTPAQFEQLRPITDAIAAAVEKISGEERAQGDCDGPAAEAGGTLWADGEEGWHEPGTTGLAGRA